MVENNLLQCCRLCLSNEGSLLNLFDPSTPSAVFILDRIHKCFPVKIAIDDQCSKNICKSCLIRVDEFHVFWISIETAQKELEKRTKENDTSDATTEHSDSNLEKSVESFTLANTESSNRKKKKASEERDKTKNHLCRECGIHKSDFNIYQKTTSQPCNVCQQIEIPTGTISKKYECSVCDYRNTSISNFKIHMKKHNGEFVAECQHCAKGFYSQTACKEHIAVKHNQQIGTNRCHQCNKAYNSKTYLRLHIKTHQPNFNKSHQCEICGTTYWSQRALKRHKMVAHLGQIYRCDVCDKEVKSLDSLKNHLKIHREEKSFICSSCGQAFRTKNGLTVHERIHTGNKPFKCSTCDQSFTQSSSLKIHIRYHTGERPYSCSECKKTYVTATHLKNHMKFHTLAKKS